MQTGGQGVNQTSTGVPSGAAGRLSQSISRRTKDWRPGGSCRDGVRSRLGFFSSGVMIPCVSVAGKVPLWRERLKMLVIGAARTSRQRFNRSVGRGSSEHDLVGDDSISPMTSPIGIVRKHSWSDSAWRRRKDSSDRSWLIAKIDLAA